MSPIRAAAGVRQPFELVAAAGTRLAVARRGAGTPVICLHATGHGGRDFAAFVEALAHEPFETIVVDWPGQGASPPDATGSAASAQRYARLVGELIERLALAERPIVIGNSIGGAAALILALERPDAVRALVLCNPGGLAPLTILARIGIAAMVALFTAGTKRRGWFRPAFAAYYRLVLPNGPAHAQRARIVAAGYETSPVMRDAWESFRSPGADLRRRVTALKVPCLFAWARRDKVVAWRWSRVAVESVPDAQVAFFDAGHTPFLEQPDAFAREFVRFAHQLRPS